MSLGNVYFKVKVLLLLIVMPLAAQYSLTGLTAILLCIIDALYSASRIKNGGLKVYASPFFAACIYLVWNILIFVLHNFSGIPRLIQVVCVTLCFFSSCCLERGSIDLRFVRKVIVFQVMLFCLWWPVSGFMTNYYSAFYGHGNFLGGLLVVYLVFLVFLHHTIDRKKRMRYLILYGCMTFLFLMSNNRAVYLTIAAFLCGCLFGKSEDPQKMRKRGVILLIGVAVIGFAFTVIYPQLLGTPLGTQLELLSRALFNKNFFSGRQTIWKNIVEQIIRSPHIGYGLTATPGMFYDTEYSSHNLWLQTALQKGLPGMAILIIFYVNAIFCSYHRDNREWYLVASFGAAYVIHECFEVSLDQNNFCLGIIVWFFLGLMVAVKKNGMFLSNDVKQVRKWQKRKTE